jgi:hypothetical protein
LLEIVIKITDGICQEWRYITNKMGNTGEITCLQEEKGESMGNDIGF